MEDILENKLICRICLKVVDPTLQSFGYVEDENGTLKEMMMCCVPEMDIFVSSDPIICLPCIQVLVALHNFKSRCINTETIIRSYMQRHNLMEYSHVNLTCVVRDLIKINNYHKNLEERRQTEMRHRLVSSNTKQEIDMDESKKNAISTIKEPTLLDTVQQSNTPQFTTDQQPTTQTQEMNDFSQMNHISSRMDTSPVPNAPTSHFVPPNPHIGHIPSRLSHMSPQPEHVTHHMGHVPSQSGHGPPQIGSMPLQMGHPYHLSSTSTQMGPTYSQMGHAPSHRSHVVPQLSTAELNQKYFQQNPLPCRSPLLNQIDSVPSHSRSPEMRPSPYETMNRRTEINHKHPEVNVNLREMGTGYTEGDNFNPQADHRSYQIHSLPNSYGYRMHQMFPRLPQIASHSSSVGYLPRLSPMHFQMGMRPPHMNYSPHNTNYLSSRVDRMPYQMNNLPPQMNLMPQQNYHVYPRTNQVHPLMAPLPPIESPVVPLAVHISTLQTSSESPLSKPESPQNSQILQLLTNKENVVHNVSQKVPELEGNESLHSENATITSTSEENTKAELPIESTLKLIIKIPRNEVTTLPDQANELCGNELENFEKENNEEISNEKENISQDLNENGRREQDVEMEEHRLHNSQPENQQTSHMGLETSTEQRYVVPESSTEQSYQCFNCPYITASSNEFLKHRDNCTAVVEKNNLKCPYCPHIASRQNALNQHINSMHTKSVWFMCEHCTYKSTDKSCLRKHTKNIHSKILESPEWICERCDFKCSSEYNFRKHISKHEVITLQCQFCSYSTTDRSNFRRHIFIHNPKSSNCDFCDYKCVSPYQMRTHLKKYHFGVGIEDVDCRSDQPLTELVDDISAAIKEANEITV